MYVVNKCNLGCLYACKLSCFVYPNTMFLLRIESMNVWEKKKKESHIFRISPVRCSILDKHQTRNAQLIWKEVPLFFLFKYMNYNLVHVCAYKLKLQRFVLLVAAFSSICRANTLWFSLNGLSKCRECALALICLFSL